jgi:mannose-1-phosphate guanylyltransferase
MIQAMILCAGRGERLRPLTDELPKPLVPVGDRPLLAHIARELRNAGYAEAVANVHWMQEKFVGVDGALDITLTLVPEARMRGVAGGISGARPWLTAPVIVWNGDILIEAPPIERLVAVAAATGGLCLGVAAPRGVGPGTVGLDASGRVVRLRGERHGIEVSSADYVGLVGVGEQALAELPELGCLIGDYCLPRLRRGEPVYTHAVSQGWWDVGSPAGYLSANQHWLTSHASPGQCSFVHPSAQFDAGITITRSVVGESVRVTGSGDVTDCVIWPGSSVQAPLAHSVITPRVSLHVGAGERS